MKNLVIFIVSYWNNENQDGRQQVSCIQEKFLKKDFVLNKGQQNLRNQGSEGLNIEDFGNVWFYTHEFLRQILTGHMRHGHVGNDNYGFESCLIRQEVLNC